MSLQATQRIIQYTGNGIATAFAIPFVFHDNSHVKIWKEVISTGSVSLLVLTTNYSLSGLNNPAGGTITLTVAPTSDHRITVARIVPYEQRTDYINNARLDADVHERQMDLIVQQVQQLADSSNLYGQPVLKFPITEPLSSGSVLPVGFNRKGTLLAFDDDTGEMELITKVSAFTPFLEAAQVSADAAAASATSAAASSTSANQAAQTAAASAVANVESALLASQTSAAASATSAAASSTSATTSSTSATTSSTSAAASATSATASSASAAASAAAAAASAAAVSEATYAELTDAATVDLPTLNTPLADALALLAPRDAPSFTGPVISLNGFSTAASGAWIATFGEGSHILTFGDNSYIQTTGNGAKIVTAGESSHIQTFGPNANIEARGGGNIETISGQFIGAGTGLTGTAAGLTAGTVTTINGRLTAGANVTLSGAGTAASPYSIASNLSAPLPPARTVIIHDDCTGTAQTIADNGTREVQPGPGTLTAWSIRDHSMLRYENGEMILTHMGTSGSSNGAVYTQQAAAAGLTIQTRFVVGATPRQSSQFSTGFSVTPNGYHDGHGGISVQGLAQTVGTEHKGIQVGITRANIYVGDATPPTENRPNVLAQTQLYPVYGMVLPGEEVAVCTHYKSLTHQQYFMQGGRTTSLGCEVGSDNWFLLGETYMNLAGVSVYPFISWQNDGVHRVRDVKVLSSWSPSPRSQCLEQHREKKGIHVSYLQQDPETGLVVAAWNSGWFHYGLTAYIDIKYATRLANGSWKDASILLPWPNSGGIGNQICHLSSVNGKLWLVYTKVDWAATSIEGGIIYRRELTINAITGAATAGSEVSLGFGTRAISFSETVEISSGRLLMPYQEDNGSGLVKPRVAYSDDNGVTWATVAVGSGTNPDSLTYLAEATITKEANGELGIYMRATGKAYYSRSTDDGVTWTQPVSRTEFPMPVGSGTRLNARNLAGGGALLVGSDHATQRRNMTVWRLDETGKVLWSKPIFDANSPDADTTESEMARSSQYPNILVTDKNDVVLSYTHQHGTNANNTFSMSVRVNSFLNFLEPVASELGGGSKIFNRDWNKNTRTAPPVFQMIYAATMTPDMSLASIHYVTLTATPATGIAAPLNPLPWTEITLVFVQGGIGSYTVPFNSIFQFNGISPVWRTVVGDTNILKATYNHRTNKWIVTSWN